MFAQRFSALIILAFLQYSAFGQQALRVAFYNVENLFHPSDDPLSDDAEFTPEGDRHWSHYRYREKLNRTAKAILAIGEWEAPAIVGLAEIENDSVLEDLINSAPLRKFNYQWVNYPSADRRGIDVALLYRKDNLKLLYSQKIKATGPADTSYTTRDILYAKLYASLFDTLHIYVNHWPSRYGGQQRSEPRRIAAARALRSQLDSLRDHDPGAQLIIVGDFNDEWHNTSLARYLCPASDNHEALLNLMTSLPETEGSHRYRGKWTYLDQIIISPNLLDGMGLEVKDSTARVLRHEFLLERDEKYPGQKPFRTFIGPRYHGGFSDHLPIFIDLHKLRPDTQPPRRF